MNLSLIHLFYEFQVNRFWIRKQRIFDFAKISNESIFDFLFRISSFALNIFFEIVNEYGVFQIRPLKLHFRLVIAHDYWLFLKIALYVQFHVKIAMFFINGLFFQI